MNPEIMADQNTVKAHVNVSDNNNTGAWTSTDYVDIPSLARNNVYFQAAFALNKYYSPFVIIFGLVGNTLSLLVMTQVNNFLTHFLKKKLWVSHMPISIGGNKIYCHLPPTLGLQDTVA